MVSTTNRNINKLHFSRTLVRLKHYSFVFHGRVNHSSWLRKFWQLCIFGLNMKHHFWHLSASCISCSRQQLVFLKRTTSWHRFLSWLSGWWDACSSSQRHQIFQLSVIDVTFVVRNQRVRNISLLHEVFLVLSFVANNIDCSVRLNSYFFLFFFLVLSDIDA